MRRGGVALQKLMLTERIREGIEIILPLIVDIVCLLYRLKVDGVEVAIVHGVV